MSGWDHAKWWWRHLVTRRLNGERKAARNYGRIHHLGEWRDR